MKISKIRKINNSGFTLIELVIVIAGLAALSSLTFPNILAQVSLNKIEEAKALMNGYAADCLGKYRTSTDPDILEESTPDQLDNLKLETLGYQIDGTKNKCSNIGIKPTNEKSDLYAFEFQIGETRDDGVKVIKFGTPSDNPRLLNSCRGWAGKNCGLSKAQKAEFARLAAIAKAKSVCLSKYNSWLDAGSSGAYVSWDKDNESCTRDVFAFEGIPVNNLEAVDKALEAKYGKACIDWRTSKIKSKYTSKNGKPQTKNPECGGVEYWFHSGNEFTTQIEWTAFDNQAKEQKCIKDRSNALRKKKKGKYTYGPSPGPEPCGKVVWLCEGSEYNSLSAYQTTKCGKIAIKKKKKKKKPAYCKNFKPSKRCQPKFKGIPNFPKKSPQCQCPYP